MEFKKVLHIGINNPFYSYEGHQDGFERNGMEYSFLDWQKIRLNEGVEGLHQRMIGKAMMERPDLIFCQLQNDTAMDTETARALSDIGFVVNFTEDVREDITWYEELAPYIGLTVFTNAFDVQKMQAKGFRNTGWMNPSYNHKWYKKQMPSKKDTGEIVFIGNNYLNTNLNFPQAQERVDMVNFMKGEFGDKFRVYGQGWEGSEYANPQQAIEIYNNCKIAITHNNFLRANYTSDRLFNSMGCGAMTISQWYPGINKDFNINVLSTWLNFEMLGQEVRKFLKNDKMRKEVGKNGYEWVRRYHTWESRVKQLKQIIDGIRK